MSDDIRERLANLVHRQWSDWMRYLFTRGKVQDDGTWVMPSWAVKRWRRQIEVPYSGLFEDEKDSDRAEADKFLVEVSSFITERMDAGSEVILATLERAEQLAEIADDWDLGRDGCVEINGEWVHCYELRDEFKAVIRKLKGEDGG